MSNRTTFVAVLLALLAGGVVLLQMHNRKDAQRQRVKIVMNTAAPDTGPLERPENSSAAAETSPTPTESATTASHPAVEITKPVVLKEAGAPLHAGETWQYSANVSKLNSVANLQLKVVEKRNVSGKSVWHLQAFAHTENPLRMVFTLDDQFDSYSDASTLVSLQYEMHLNEKGQIVNSVQRLTANGREPAPADAIAVRVLPGTRDPLGMMQYLRTVDWSKVPEVHSPVYDGHKLYDVYARLQARGEQVTVPAGNFSALKIELRVLDNGAEMKDAHFVLYLTDTEARTPVLLEAVMPFAVARVELTKAQ